MPRKTNLYTFITFFLISCSLTINAYSCGEPKHRTCPNGVSRSSKSQLPSSMRSIVERVQQKCGLSINSICRTRPHQICLNVKINSKIGLGKYYHSAHECQPKGGCTAVDLGPRSIARSRKSCVKGIARGYRVGYHAGHVHMQAGKGAHKRTSPSKRKRKRARSSRKFKEKVYSRAKQRRKETRARYRRAKRTYTRKRVKFGSSRWWESMNNR